MQGFTLSHSERILLTTYSDLLGEDRATEVKAEGKCRIFVAGSRASFKKTDLRF